MTIAAATGIGLILEPEGAGRVAMSPVCRVTNTLGRPAYVEFIGCQYPVDGPRVGRSAE